MTWYIIQTKPNYEAKVIEGMERKRIDKNLKDIYEIFAPEETIIDFKDGKRRERKKRLYTNYVFVHMEYSDQLFHELKDVRGMIGLIGKIPDAEVEKMKQTISEAPRNKISIEAGTTVKINQGSFEDFSGIVQSVDYEKNKVTLMLQIFGRETNVTLDIEHISLENS
jgi:transcription termination/antitermination protein NusG